MTIVAKKSQILMEFMLFSGVALIATIIFVASLSQNKTLHDTREFFLVKDTALQIKNEISATSDVNDGYNRQFTLPDKINNRGYNISIVNNTLTLWTNFTNTTYTTRILNITGYLKKDTNTIKKTNGIVYIN